MPKSKRKKRSQSKSGYFGVTKSKQNRYQAQIWIKGNKQFIGTYDTVDEAAKAYDQEAIKSRRAFSKLNFPKKTPVGYTPRQQTLQANNTVGYRGVSKNAKRFRAKINIAFRQTTVGLYDTAKEAAIAYDRAVLKANQSTTKLNFPDMVHNLDVEPKRIKHKLSSTGYRGVKKVSSGRFAARIKRKGKEESLGTFDTAIGAALAYDQAAIKKGNKKSTLNFPDGLPIKEKEKEIAKDGGYLVEGFIIQSYL